MFPWLRKRQTERRFSGQTIVFGIHAGGLGDHLAYSFLPRLYKHYGADKVLLSSITNHGEPFSRNPEIPDLVWKDNPYLDGFTDETPNVGELRWPLEDFFKIAKFSRSPVECVAKLHGMEFPASGPGFDWMRPDVPYRPSARPDFAGKTVVDARSTSQPFSTETIEKFVRYVCQWYQIDRSELVVLTSLYAGQYGAEALQDLPRCQTRNLHEYIDIVHSAKNFLVSEAGGQSVAAIVRERNTYVLCSSRFYNERCFVWPRNTYCVSGASSPGDAEWP